jgi:Fic family protein
MKVVTKKIGNQKYFYLKHSTRKGAQVITKEKYIGTEIPANIDKLMREFRTEIQKDINRKMELIKAHFQAEWKRVPESARKKELEEISIAFTYNTNAIEGSTITLAETREIIHDKIAPNKPLRDIKETEAHSAVFLKMLNMKDKVTNDLLLTWHDEIFGITKPDIAGKYRAYFVRIGQYLAPDWQDVEDLMNKLVEFIIKNAGMNPVELAARAHYKFEKIHPFGDGNGRIGRLLMNYILWRKGYPMLIIERNKRKAYYLALQKGEEAFLSYFMRRYLSVHRKRLVG